MGKQRSRKSTSAVREDQPVLPSQEEVAFRALALLGLLCRTQAEYELHRDPSGRQGWSNMLKRLSQWLKAEGILPYQSAVEKKALGRPLGRWTEGRAFEMTWRTEALAALLWALNKLPTMPSYEKRVDSQHVFGHTPVLEPVGDWLRSVRLRSRAQIEAASQVAEFWHWRARTEMLRRQGFVPPDGDTFEACIRRAAESALKKKIIPKLVRGDAPMLGKSYGKLTDAQYANAHSVAAERHYAFNWLCGFSDDGDWDSTRTDT
jgi:hypothetical protein